MTAPSNAERPSILVTLRTKIKRTLCSHQDDMYKVTGTRMYLKCMNCGRETEGWDVTPKGKK